MALAIDASTPAAKSVAANVTSAATNSFSPPANSVIVLFVALDGPATQTQNVTAVTDNLVSHLTWARITGAQANAVQASNLGGCVEVWYASCPSAQTNMTVSPTWNVGSGASFAPDGLLLPVVFTGAATIQNGAVTAQSQTTLSTPSLAVTTTRAGSRVFGVLENWTNGTGATVGTNQTATINGNSAILTNSSDGDAYWVQMQNANTTASGTSVTINDTAPTSIRFQFVVVEILAAGGTTKTATLTATGSGVVSLSRQPKAIRATVSGVGLASRSARLASTRTATGVGTASLGRLTAHSLTASGVGLVSVGRMFGRTLTASGIGIVTAPAKVLRSTKFVFGVATASRSAQVQGVRSVTGVGVPALVKLTAKPLTASGVGLVGVTFSKAKLLTLTASGIGVASLTRQAQAVRSVAGTGVVSVVKAIAETRTASGVGVASITRRATKTLTSSGTGVVSIQRTAGAVKAVTGIGLPSIVKSVAKTRTATGVGSVVLIKSPRHSLSASGTGVVSIASVVIPFVPAGPTPGFVELFLTPIATVDLADELRASVTLNLEPLATVDLFLAKVG